MPSRRRRCSTSASTYSLGRGSCSSKEQLIAAVCARYRHLECGDDVESFADDPGLSFEDAVTNLGKITYHVTPCQPRRTSATATAAALSVASPSSIWQGHKLLKAAAKVPTAPNTPTTPASQEMPK